MLIVGSGNVVHNLRGMDWQLTDTGYDWAQRFDEQAEQLHARPTRPQSPASTRTATSRTRCRRLTTSSPLLYLAGLAGAAGDRPTDVLVDGYAYGSLSMTAYTLDLPCPQAATASSGAAADLPLAVPPDNSNL